MISKKGISISISLSNASQLLKSKFNLESENLCRFWFDIDHQWYPQ